MVELLLASEPLAGLAATGAAVRLAPRSGLGLATVIARRGVIAELAGKVRALYDFELPAGPKRAAQGDLAFVGVGPNIWLAVQEGAPDTLAPRLMRDLAGLASISDQSSAYAVIRSSGSRTQQALAKRLFIDLHPRAFAADDVAVSNFGLMNGVLWRTEQAYELAVSRSFAEEAWRALVHDSAEFNAS